MFRYQKATELFEEIARKSINNNLLKYGVRGILLNAGLCQLCRGDTVAINNSLERFQVQTVPLNCQLVAIVNFLNVTFFCRTLTQPSQGHANTSFWRYHTILTFLLFTVFLLMRSPWLYIVSFFWRKMAGALPCIIVGRKEHKVNPRRATRNTTHTRTNTDYKHPSPKD
jgi:hypothetical protein